MNKYIVIITDNQGGIFEKVYEIPEQTSVIDYLLDSSSLVYDLQDSNLDIPSIIMEVYLESPIEIKDQESLVLELQENIINKVLDFNYINKAIFDGLNKIGLTYHQGDPLPLRIKRTILQLLSDNLPTLPQPYSEDKHRRR